MFPLFFAVGTSVPAVLQPAGNGIINSGKGTKEMRIYAIRDVIFFVNLRRAFGAVC